MYTATTIFNFTTFVTAYKMRRSEQNTHTYTQKEKENTHY